jgi:hypothetical protein
MRARLAGPIALLFVLAACSTLSPGADPVVVNAERTTALAVDTFDTFLHLEYNNRAQLAAISPEIHKYAETIRRNGQTWLQTARTLTQAYKTNGTAQNKASLETAIAVLAAAISDSQKYIAQAQSATAAHP